MQISNLQIYNALNAYGKQLSFSGFVRKRKSSGITSDLDMESTSMDSGSQASDETEEEENP